MAEIYSGTDGAPTGNVYLDSLILGGAWVEKPGTSVTLTWATATAGSLGGNDYADQPAWTSAETDALAAALKAWANVANITFSGVADDTAGLDLRFIKVTDAQMDEDVGKEFAGVAQYPTGSNTKPLTCLLNADIAEWTAGFQPGGGGFSTMVHEIGHMLGLAHPHPGDNNADPFPGVDNSSDSGDNALNQKLFTVMSYVPGISGNPGPYASLGRVMGPMAFDIAAIQALYGANTTFASGDNVYALPQTNTAGTGWSCIWDTGGTDEITADGSNVTVVIDLRPAPLVGTRAGGYVSLKAGIAGGFTIANGVVIENATGGTRSDNIYGNEAANLLRGGDSGDDLIFGYGGADTLVGGIGWDRMNGGEGDDSIDGGWTGRDRLTGAAGNDTLRAYGDASTLSGGTGNDDLAGSTTGDLLFGDADNDSLDGRGGQDNLDGGAGNDTMTGGTGNDSLYGGLGNDLMYGDGASENEGDDTVFGWSGADTILGGGGDDLLLGHSGNDSIDGGKGDDNINAGPGNDTVLGQDSDDYIAGGDNNDSLLGGEGDDQVFGNAGMDRLRGGSGGDTLSGDDDADDLRGEEGADSLLGGKGDDYLSGWTENDTMDGGVGNDRLYAGDGDDVVQGGTGNDVVSGANGADTLNGGEGADTLYGGAGADLFVIGSVLDALAGMPDVIQDFSARSSDRIDFRLIDASGRQDGDQAFIFYAVRPSNIGMGTLWLETGRDGLVTLFGEVTGDAIADIAIALPGVVTLTEASFLL